MHSRHTSPVERDKRDLHIFAFCMQDNQNKYDHNAYMLNNWKVGINNKTWIWFIII